VWLLVAVLLLSQGWLRGINLVALIACVLIALWVGNVAHVFLRFGLKRVQVHRRVEGTVFAGQPFLMELEVVNASGRGQAAVRVDDEGADHRVSWFLPRLGKGRTHLHTVTVELPERGPYAWHGPRVSSGYPLGLAVRTVRRETREATLVLPQLGHLHLGRLKALVQQRQLPPPAARGRARRTPGAQLDFCGLREFRPGDSPRWIHWRTSARAGRLMVREFEEPPLENLVVVLEAIRPEPIGAGMKHAPLERAISFAATICWNWHVQPGAGFVLAIADREPLVIGASAGGCRGYAHLQALAQVAGTSSLDAAAFAQHLSRELLPQGPILLLSPGPSRLSRVLADRLRRPIAVLTMDDPEVDAVFSLEARRESPQDKA
jgi:uncharacterized protein (DUF58 family)